MNNCMERCAEHQATEVSPLKSYEICHFQAACWLKSLQQGRLTVPGLNPLDLVQDGRANGADEYGRVSGFIFVHGVIRRAWWSLQDPWVFFGAR